MNMDGLLTYFLMYLIVAFSGKDVTAPNVDIENLNDVITPVAKRPRSTNSRTSGLSARSNEENSATESYFPDLAEFDYNERSRIIIDSLDANHPLRERRDITCNLPSEMVNDITILYEILNRTMYVAGNVKQYPATVFQPVQGQNCPPDDHFFFYPACPTFRMNYFLGKSAVPSYLPMTICRCPRCLKYPDLNCEAVLFNSTFYEHIGCSNGLAFMSKQFIRFSIGCVCAKMNIEKVGK